MLPIPIVPDEPHANELYRALGKGMARWQYIETCLYLAAFGAKGVEHADCSAAFFRNPGAGSRLAFTDRALRDASLPHDIYRLAWEPIREEVYSFLKFRNALAHFEVFHLNESQRALVSPPTAFNVVISASHMNFTARDKELVDCLSIEGIHALADRVRKLTYKMFYFIIDVFPEQTFLDKGFLPLVERQIVSFRSAPRPSEFPAPAWARR